MNKEKILLLILASINFTHIVDFMIMMPLGTYLMPLFNISPQQFSFLVSSYTFSAGIAGFIAAFFVDKFDRKYLLLFGYTGFVFGTLACAFAPDYHMLLAARILAGMFGGLISAQVLSIVGDVFPFERRGAAMGTLMAAFSAASVVGVPLGLFLADIFNWHAPFLLVGGIGFLVIPMIYFFVPNVNAHLHGAIKESNPFAVLSNIAKDSNRQTGLLMMVALMLGHFAIIPFIAPYLVSNVGFQESQISLVYFIGGGLTIFTGPIIGRLADKHGKLKVLTTAVLLSSIPVFLITHLTEMSIYFVLVITSMFFVLATGRMIPAQAMITSVVPPSQRGGFMSINSSVQQLASGTAALIAGAIVIKAADSDKLLNYEYVGYIAIIISFSAILIARRLKTPETAPEYFAQGEIKSPEEQAKKVLANGD